MDALAVPAVLRAFNPTHEGKGPALWEVLHLAISTRHPALCQALRTEVPSKEWIRESLKGRRWHQDEFRSCLGFAAHFLHVESDEQFGPNNSRSFRKYVSEFYGEVLEVIHARWNEMTETTQESALLFLVQFSSREGEHEIHHIKNRSNEEAQLTVQTVGKLNHKYEWIVTMLRDAIRSAQDVEDVPLLRWWFAIYNMILRYQVGRAYNDLPGGVRSWSSHPCRVAEVCAA